MNKALADKPYRYFDIPDDVVQVRIDSSTGLLASDNFITHSNSTFRKMNQT